MILHHRKNGIPTAEYTMALDRVEFIAIQCAVKFALDTIKQSGDPFTEDKSIDLSIIYGALDIELRHPTEK